MDKVPISIMPEWLWVEHRVIELQAAINSYWEAGLRPDDRWVTELNKHLDYLSDLRRKPQ